MKKIIITLGLWLLATGLWAQNDTGAKVVPVSQAIQNNGYTMQVGVPYLVDTEQSSTIVDVSNPNINDDIYPFDIRFPWDALYLFPTFAEESFDVSKGYFGDKILINWTLRANNLRIYTYSSRNITPLVMGRALVLSFIDLFVMCLLHYLICGNRT